ncbi:hypothetical protein LPJ56_003748 [Coemansia sp. RSA 2599]|nr:hypothetical protein LPJ75_003511 [Coemansia sp. RSA 2598]KAJ1818932.1 hypothetical protein LPJ56_003748 [Coemansia sp. RSA 2599]
MGLVLRLCLSHALWLAKAHLRGGRERQSLLAQPPQGRRSCVHLPLALFDRGQARDKVQSARCGPGCGPLFVLGRQHARRSPAHHSTARHGHRCDQHRDLPCARRYRRQYQQQGHMRRLTGAPLLCLVMGKGRQGRRYRLGQLLYQRQ